MSFIKPLVKDWLPPVLLRAVRQLHGKGIRFKGNYKTWEEAPTRCALDTMLSRYSKKCWRQPSK